MSEDNWSNRKEDMVCFTCVFYVPKEIKKHKKTCISELGRCRASQPTMKGFPAVFENDWCGNHKLDENKI